MQIEQTFLQLAEELEPMPEVGNQYIGAKIMFPRGNEMARGQVGAKVMTPVKTSWVEPIQAL